MAVTAQRVTVTTTATALNAAGGTAGQSIAVKNGSTAIDLGGSTVASVAGYSLAASGTVAVDLGPGDVLYAITGAGTSAVEVLRT